MNRFNRRISRILIAILIVALGSGIAVTLHRRSLSQPPTPTLATPQTPASADQQLSRIAAAELMQTATPKPVVTLTQANAAPNTPPASAVVAVTAAAQQPASTQPTSFSVGSVASTLR